jgi:hypothetical protein
VSKSRVLRELTLPPSGAPTQLSGPRCLLHALPHCLCIQPPSVTIDQGLRWAVSGGAAPHPRARRLSVQILNRRCEDRDRQPAHTLRVQR